MRRYRFNIQDGVKLGPPRHGFAADQDARKYAEEMAQTVSRSDWRQSHTRFVVFADDDGDELFAVKVPEREQ
jgi:hypothetical protein